MSESQEGRPAIDFYTKTVHHDVYDRISPSRPELSMKGKHVLVTGGGSGIGLSIAINFAKAGADVSIVGRRKDRLEAAAEKIGGAVQYETVDLTKRSEVDEAFERLGKIDILVSNAGTMPAFGPAVGYEVDQLKEAFDTNVVSAFNAVQAFLKSGGKMVISISSGIAHVAPMPGTFGYAVNKAANLKMMDFFAAEGVHVVSVHPGVVKTEMSSQNNDVFMDTVELPGAFCVWLASDEARFLNGKYVWSNWDVDELIEKKEEIEKSRLLTCHLDGVDM